MAFVSSSSGIVIVDSRSKSGSITLPAASTLVGRSLIFKDGFDSFGTSSLTLLTTGVDRFDNLSSILNVGETNGFINLVASSNKWHTVGGTRLVSQNVDNNNVSTINGIVVNNNLYVIGSSNGILSYSVDDVNWINSTSQPFVGYNITGIVYNGSYWLASSSGPVNLAISFDGINWTAINQINLGSINSIIWNGSLWIITTSNGIWSSTNNINWTLKYYSPFPIFGIDYNGTRYVSIGVNTFNNTPIVNYSADLINWTDSPTIILDNIDIYVYSVKWNGSLWIIGGVNYGSKTLLYSVDGINWSVTNNTGLDTIYSIDWNGSIWVAGGIKNTSYGGIAYSVDGLTWSESSSADSILSNFNGSIYNFTWDGKFWRAIGFYNNNGVILTSPDGINWKLKNNSLTSSTLKSIENSRFAPSVYGVISTTTITLRSSITLLNTQLISSVNGSDNNLVSSITGLGTTGYLSSIPQNIITENIITSSITLSSITFISYSSFYTQYGYGNMEYESTFVNTTSINNQIYLCNANKVAYGNGLWLVAGSSSNTNNNSASNVIFRSSDTSNWALSFSTTFNTYINGIAYGSNRWVAVGQNNGSPPNSIYTSVDAITWTSSFNDPLINSGVSRYRAVAYGNNKWVAVGQNWSAASNNQTIVYSSDGIVWYQSANNPFPGGIGYSVGYGNNLWIATANGVSSIIATSSNGINWNAAQSSPFDNGYILDIKYANGKWVAVGFSVVGNIMYSTDGSNWTPSSIFTFTGRSVAHDGSKWIAGGEGSAGPVMFTGTDGINWSPVTNNFQDGNVQGIAYANSTWLSVGLSNSIEYFSTIQRSANGLDWTLGTASQTLSTLKYTSTFSYVSSFSTYTSPITILKSTIAEALTLTSTVITINGVPYSPPNFKTSVLDLEYPVSTIVVPTYTYSNSVVTTIVYGNDQWLAGCTGGLGTDNKTSIWNNSNEWITDGAAANVPLNQLSYNNNQWVGVGGDSAILVGYDGYNWQSITVPITIDFKTVAYNGQFWLAGGHAQCNIGSIHISADGFNWYAQSNSLVNINSIARGYDLNGSNLWVALGDTATYIHTSVDGSNWILRTSALQQGNTVTYGSNLWLAGGINQNTPTDSIETSTDGTTWTPRSNQLKVVNAIAYNDGKWVATGIHATELFNGIETSVDGSNWTTVSSMIAVGKTVAYGNGMWIAGGHQFNSTAIIEYSLDGTTWNTNINYFQKYPTILTTQSNKLLVNSEPIIGDNIKLSSLIANNVGLLYNYIGNNYRKNVNTEGANQSNINVILYAKNLLMVAIPGSDSDSIRILNNENWIIQPNKVADIRGIDYHDGMWVSVGVGLNPMTDSGIQLSIDGSNWIYTVPGPDKADSINCVKYGNGLWLLGGQGNTNIPSIQISSNAANWGFQSNNIENVIKFDYGNSLWVAVGKTVSDVGSTIQTSVDGSNWTLQSNSLYEGYSIKYANNLWVAGGCNLLAGQPEGTSTTIQTSPDGSNWTAQPNYLDLVNDIAYYDGLWLSVGSNFANSNQCIQTSPDGSNWTPQTASILHYGKSIGYSNGVWIVGGTANIYTGPYNIGLIEYSYDTINWTSTFVTSSITTASTVITGLSNSIFVNGVPVGGGGGGGVQSSDLTSSIQGLGTIGYISSGVGGGIGPQDLASTVQGLGTSGYLSSGLQMIGLESTVQGLGTVGYLSSGVQKDELTSSIQGLGTFAYLSSPTRYITDSFCVAGGQNNDASVYLQASYDGFNWINASNQPFGTIGSGQVNGVSFNGSYWVASGNGLCSIAVSYDGFNWTVSSNDPFGSNGIARASAWNGSYWVVVGNSTDSSVTIATSYDGLNWTSSLNNLFSNGGGTGVAWNGYMWIATGSNYVTSNGAAITDTVTSIIVSYDGLNWVATSNNPFSAVAPYTGIANGIAWNGSYWVAVGQCSADGSPYLLSIAVSLDGFNWTASSNNPFNAPGGWDGTTVARGNKIAWNGSKWLAVGITASNEYSMATSSNGYNWAYPSSNPFTEACTDITWNGSYWVASSTDYGKIATSPDTINWTVQPTSLTGGQRYAVASRNVLPYIGKNIIPAATTTLYIPSYPSIWVAPPPSTIQGAIDRLAVLLSTFTTSNIP